MRVYVYRDVEVQGWWKSIATPQCFEHFVVVVGVGGGATVTACYRVHCVGSSLYEGVYNVHSYIFIYIYIIGVYSTSDPVNSDGGGKFVVFLYIYIFIFFTRIGT